MKILYDYAIFSMQAHGGVSRVMGEVIQRELVRAGVEARVCAGIYQNLELARLARRFPKNIHGWFLPASLARERVLLPLNRLRFEAFARKFAPDICHYTFFQTPAVPARTKVVVTVHDLIGEIFNAPGTDPQVALRRAALARADGIICVSENTKRDLGRFYDLGRKPVLVVPHGNSLREVTPAALAAVGFSFALYVGSREAAYKNFELVLKTFANRPQLGALGLVCFGGGDFTARERALISAAGLAGRVVCRAGDDAILAGYYRAATALIYPSKYEGFGLPLVEAMGSGCPVVASAAPPMPEVVGDAGLFFGPQSPDELGAALERLLTEPGLREELVRRGRAREEQFCWDKSADEIHRFYAGLLAHRQA